MSVVSSFVSDKHRGAYILGTSQSAEYRRGSTERETNGLWTRKDEGGMKERATGKYGERAEGRRETRRGHEEIGMKRG
jgi:hypothetical protein